MITKNTLLANLPGHVKLIAHCYACNQTIPVDIAKYQQQTVHQVSEQMDCPVCKSDNLAIRPVLQPRRFNIRSLLRLFKPKNKTGKLRV